MVAGDAGLGFLIVVFSRHLDTAEMFATVLITAVLGVSGFFVVVATERLLCRRYGFLAQSGEIL